jgi:MFS family permease
MPLKNKLLVLLISINFLIILAAGFMTPVWAQFVQQIGGDLRTAGNAVCIFSIILGMFTWFTAYIENNLKKDPLIIMLSQLMFAISYAGYFFIHTPNQLYLVQIALGICGAIQVPALFALYQRNIPSNQATFYWGLWNGFYNIAMGLGALISAYTVEKFGMRSMFHLLLSVAICCFIFTLLIFPTISTQQELNKDLST